jgi:endogenous inhibitor of DNA gyrase (YacG/DUF329 family)
MASDNVIKLHPTRPCPVCKKPSSQASFPFCSPRCADIDLNRWLSGAYIIPGGAADPDEVEPGTPLAGSDGDEF